jgi:hypothetical protein
VDIDVDAASLNRMARRYLGAPAAVADELRQAMTRSVLAVEASAKRVVPVDTGHLRRAITHEVRVAGSGVVGRVGSNAPYARIVEEGRTPGAMPPAGALLGWMGRKGIPADREFVIRRAVNRRKVARPYLKPAITANAARINREFGMVPRRVMQRLSS